MSDLGNHHRVALQHAESGDWDAAHALVQVESDAFSALIHAYLHRVEGDLGNAAYWYRRAGESPPDISLEAELKQLRQRVEKAADAAG